MNEKIYIRVIETHQLLDEYIIIHDVLIASTKGLLGFLRKIFKPIDFDLYVHKLTAISNNMKENLSKLEEIDNHNLQEKELQLKKVLFLFIIDFQKTVEKLAEINQKLSRKADGKAYSMNEYNKDMKEYHFLIVSYTVTGRQLNKIFKKQD